ncbi:MAG: tetratricopeptide repeat protein [Acidobacteriia bacterium]|nr:tetratricopeptide repeat protein [Terriglobia bacterium]
MKVNRLRTRLALGTLLVLLAPLIVEAQATTNRGTSNAGSGQSAVFNIRGKVYSEYTNIVPEILEVRLEKNFTPIAQAYLRSDHGFEFTHIPAGNYNVVIKDSRFEDVNLQVEVFGHSSQTFYVNVVLTVRKDDKSQPQGLDADDDLGDTVSVTLLSTKVPPKALKLYHKALELDHQKKYPEAIEELKLAVSIFPDFYSAQRNLGILYFTSGKYSDSMAALQTASRLNPGSAKVQYFLGLNCVNLDDLVTALDHFGRVIALAPQKAGAYYFRGYIFYKQNRLDEAEKSLKKALELDDAFSSYSRLQLANVYMKESQLSEAYHQMEVFLKETPSAQEVSQVMTNLKILKEIIGQPPNQP